MIVKEGDGITLTRDGTTNISGMPEEAFLTGTGPRNSALDLREGQQATIAVMGADLFD